MAIKSERMQLPGRVYDGVRFDGIFIGLCGWIIAGVFIDGWAHANGATDDTFFTPWHAVLYSGFFAVFIFFFSSLYVNRQRGYTGWDIIPAGYKLTLIGLLMFGIGGVGDMIWHELFGVEADLEAIVSPTHLFLAVALGLIVSGPIRTAWQRPERTPSNPIPLILSLTFTLIALSLLTLYAHPFIRLHLFTPFAQAQELGMASILLQTGILMGFLLLVMKRWQLPAGSILFMLTLQIACLMAIGSNFVLLIPAILTGLVADAWNHLCQPARHLTAGIRRFAFVVPVLFYLTYFLTLFATGQRQPVIHLWVGGVVLSGIAGWLVSYLIWPPDEPKIVE